jgi:hypothetical protein
MGTGRVRRRPLRLVERKVLYSWRRSTRSPVARCSPRGTRRSGSRAAALLRLAAVTIGRTDTALGAFYGRLSARIGKVKAIIATARKIAVRFYNAMRHGMDYSSASKLRIIWDARNGRIPWRESQTKDAIEWFHGIDHLRQPWRVLLRDPLSCAAHRQLIGVPKRRSRPPTAPAAVS